MNRIITNTGAMAWLALVPFSVWNLLSAQETVEKNSSALDVRERIGVDFEQLHGNRRGQLREYPASHALRHRWKWDLERSLGRLDDIERSGTAQELKSSKPSESFGNFEAIRSTVHSGFSLEYPEQPRLEYETQTADGGIPISALCGRPQPGTDQVWYAMGSKIFSRGIVDRAVQDKTIIEYLPDWLVYSFAFAPGFPEDSRVFIFCNGARSKFPKYNRILSVKLENREGDWTPEGHPNTLLEWESNGHDGGDLLFGKDGFLYIATGDGSQDSDQYLSAQNFSDLRGGVLRIDVSTDSGSSPYRIPKDNPFLAVPNARPELYAKGLRNPWRMTMDSLTGAIYLGNSGQDTTESIYLLEPGANFGWSVWEGGKLFQEKRPLGPGKLTFPLVDHEHDEARSMTGGIVYRGKKFPELYGHYIYGDYETGRIWGAKIENNRFVSVQELANTRRNIFGFYESKDGDIVVLGPTISHLTKKLDSEPDRSVYFPRRLSETGLFDSVPQHRLSSSVEPYQIAAPSWNDNAKTQRYFYFPDGLQLQIGARNSVGWYLPANSVVAQTLSLPRELMGTKDDLRIETRILVSQGKEWSAYSYLWNRKQTDAMLVERNGLTVDLGEHFGIAPPVDQSTWSIPSRSACFSCHSFNHNTVLGVTTLQLSSASALDQREEHQFDRWEQQSRWKFIRPRQNAGGSEKSQLVNPYDPTVTLEQRVRSYLHVNCSSCHTGGGNSKLNLKYAVSTEETGLLDAYPEHSDYGIPDARIVASGDPQRSILLKRISTNSGGKMPPLGRSRVDKSAVAMITEWISGLNTHTDPIKEWTFEELEEFIDSRPLISDAEQRDNGKRVFNKAGCAQCHRIGQDGVGYGPDLTNIGIKNNPKNILRSLLEPSYEIAPEYRSWYYRLADGRVVQGTKIRETDQEIQILEKDGNGQVFNLLKSTIEEFRPSDISSMPKGLLSKYNREDILDLVAFIMSQSKDK